MSFSYFVKYQVKITKNKLAYYQSRAYLWGQVVIEY